MEQVLLVIHVIIAAALIGMVLIQRSDTDGFGLGSGSGSNLLSGRATANLLTRTTAIFATLFIVNSLVLSILAANRTDVSLIDQIEQEQREPVKEAPDTPTTKPEKKAPTVPNADTPVKTEKPAAAKKPSVPAAKGEDYQDETDY